MVLKEAFAMKAAVVGASGYTGEVLLKLLARHPQVTVTRAVSRSLAGQRADNALPRLRGQLGESAFTADDPATVAAGKEEVVFLALPHGAAAEFALPLLAAGKTVIDLSADFRLGDAAVYEATYGAPHPAPEQLAATPYVLPEIADVLAPDWAAHPLIACPGCYPTSVQLPLFPLLRDRLVDPEGVVINSGSGVSGAGKKAHLDFSYGERWQSAKAYGAPHHRHVPEIEEQLTWFVGEKVVVQFTPHLLPTHSGIATTIVVPARGDLDAIYEAWETAYAGRPFIHFLPPGTFPDTQNVVGSNRAELSAVVDDRTGNALLFSTIDNLYKGAGGQAVQILNLKMGWAETEGLA